MGEKVRLGGQDEDEDDRRPHVTSEEDAESSRGAGLDFDTADIRRLATTSSSSTDGQAELYPNCTSLDIAFGSKIGDNYCDSIFNKEECGYDGGDCCECDCLQALESSISTNYSCGVNSYNCLDPSSSCFEDLYPDCVERGGTLEWIGTGACAIENNIAECGYDGGDCCECDCVGNLENRCGVNGFDCRDPSSPLECPEEVPTPSPQTLAPTVSPALMMMTEFPVSLTASPVGTTPIDTTTTEGGGGSDDSIAVEIVIGVASTVVGGVVLALVTKHCLGERGSSS
eukprot:g7892.t1